MRQARSLGHHTVKLCNFGQSLNFSEHHFSYLYEKDATICPRGGTGISDGPGPGCADRSMQARVLPNVDIMSCPHGQGPWRRVLP